ncbi:MAG: hypothetical protein Q7S28_03470 [bacterium]|nr:hypothetical protein [bacterium]
MEQTVVNSDNQKSPPPRRKIKIVVGIIVLFFQIGFFIIATSFFVDEYLKGSWGGLGTITLAPFFTVFGAIGLATGLSILKQEPKFNSIATFLGWILVIFSIAGVTFIPEILLARVAANAWVAALNGVDPITYMASWLQGIDPTSLFIKS